MQVMYTTDPAQMAALGLVQASASTTSHPGASHVIHYLALPEIEERRAVVEALRRSSELLHPCARCVGALKVGFLPVAPTWT